jgi:hypothetical protein
VWGRTHRYFQASKRLKKESSRKLRFRKPCCKKPGKAFFSVSLDGTFEHTMNNEVITRTSRIAMASSIFYLIFQILDIYFTYRITPNLHREANFLVARFDLGWKFVILSAIVASVIMFAAQFWVWKSLRRRFPADKQHYSAFYHHILYDEPSSKQNPRHDTKGIVISILMILLYSLIASKFLVVIWNASVLFISIRAEAFTHFMLIKNILAGLFGLFMFFLYLYLLYRETVTRTCHT